MTHSPELLTDKTVLITGAAHRIGATVVKLLHSLGANIALHYRSSAAGAEALREELESQRPNSISLHQADLHDEAQLMQLVDQAVDRWKRLDVLINNASSFYPTPIGEVSLDQWNDLIGTNLKAPFFLSQAAAPHLSKTEGCVVNIVDIHAERPLKSYPVYSVAKAGLVMLTKALAGELGPEVRVNAVAPGAILWPEHDMDDETKQRIVSRTFLKRQGNPNDIAKTVLFLIRDSGYITGQIIAVDGGRTLNS